MAGGGRRVDWAAWLGRWDRQQTGYIPSRESRFATMLDIVAAEAPPDLRAMDLACGPGSLSQRLLSRFPRARCVAVDFDPVLLEMGRHALARFRRRLRWVEADLRDPGWVASLPPGPFDAILSTTALHWLSAPDLARLYRELHGLLRKGGLFMNGDHMAFEPALPTLRDLAKQVHRRRESAGFRGRGTEDWEEWWSRLEGERSLAPLFAERRRRFPRAHHAEEEYLARFHEACLRKAGFREVGIVWQELDNRVILGIA